MLFKNRFVLLVVDKGDRKFATHQSKPYLKHVQISHKKLILLLIVIHR